MVYISYSLYIMCGYMFLSRFRRVSQFSWRSVSGSRGVSGARNGWQDVRKALQGREHGRQESHEDGCGHYLREGAAAACFRGLLGPVSRALEPVSGLFSAVSRPFQAVLLERKGNRRIGLEQFDTALELIAEKKGMLVEDVWSHVRWGLCLLHRSLACV